jgi:hypothetical protein
MKQQLIEYLNFLAVRKKAAAAAAV